MSRALSTPDYVDYDDCSNLGKEMGTLDDITTYEDWQPVPHGWALRRLDRVCAERLTSLTDTEFYHIGRQI